MKYILFIVITLIPFSLLAQKDKDMKLLVNNWTQGKKDPSGKVVKADVSRAGWYQLKINADSTLIFNDPFSCGFGYEKQGTWQQQGDTVIRFVFTRKVGYMNSKGTTEINETEQYKILRLEKDALILEQQETANPRTLILMQDEVEK